MFDPFQCTLAKIFYGHFYSPLNVAKRRWNFDENYFRFRVITIWISPKRPTLEAISRNHIVAIGEYFPAIGSLSRVLWSWRFETKSIRRKLVVFEVKLPVKIKIAEIVVRETAFDSKYRGRQSTYTRCFAAMDSRPQRLQVDRKSLVWGCKCTNHGRPNLRDRSMYDVRRVRDHVWLPRSRLSTSVFRIFKNIDSLPTCLQGDQKSVV